MKREFAFDDALRMLEVLWASLPQATQATELSLKEKPFDPTLETDNDPPPLSPLVKTHRENAYTKVCAIRRQSSSFSLTSGKPPKLAICKPNSLDENVSRQKADVSLKHAKEFQSLDDATLREHKLEGGDNLGDKNNDPITAKDIKRNIRKSMQSVPEFDKTFEDKSSTTGLTNGRTSIEVKDTPLGSQIRLLRDKISSHNNKFFSSLDKLENSVDNDKPKVKLIRNLNEFLNFSTGTKSSNCNTESKEKLQRTRSVIVKSSTENRKIVKTSFEESDLESKSTDPRVEMKSSKKNVIDTKDGSSPDDSQEYYPMTTSMTRELRLELEHLDRQVFGPTYVNRCSVICDSPSESTSTEEKPVNDCAVVKDDSSVTTLETQSGQEIVTISRKSHLFHTGKANVRSAEDIFVWENPLHKNTPAIRAASCPHTPDEQQELDFDVDTGEIIQENSGKKSITPIRLLRKNRSAETDERHSITHSSDTDSSEIDPIDPLISSVKNNNQETEESNFKGSRSQKFFSSMSQELENAKRNCESLLIAKQPNLHSVASTINSIQKKYDVFRPPIQRNLSVPSGSGDGSTKYSISSLPPPFVFGGGNPFLMFLCLTVLLQHREYIMRNRMDYNELAMHFDKMVRKHNVNRVLNQARQMYAIYLKQQAMKTGDITT